MIVRSQPRVVLLGMMTKIPVAGVVWNAIHYMLGLQRLGCDVFYVEEHARTPSMLMERPKDDGSLRAATFIRTMMERFGFEHRWAYRALHDDGRCFGMSDRAISALHASADLIINLHGSTIPAPEHYVNGRLVFLETDPVDLQLELHEGRQEAISFLEPHVAFFTWGQNYGNFDCALPYSARFRFQPTRPPVVPDLWQVPGVSPRNVFTTVGNWRQKERRVLFQGERYTWSKHFEFMKIIDLPRRTDQLFELALSSYTDDDQRMLEGRGWQVRHALDISTDTDAYRQYIASSYGEFTVAKDQNVRFRSGWFSERSAAYLAAGRPVINQETGFGSVLPIGEGLFSFSTIDDVLEAVHTINGDHERHCRAAAEIAREYFSYDVVLPPILEFMGISHTAERSRGTSFPALVKPFPADMVVQPVSRFPTTLPEETVALVDRSRVQGALPGYDVVCLAPITPDGYTAWQNVFNQLAHSGHRVIYLQGSGTDTSGGVYTRVRFPNLIEVTVSDDRVPYVDGPMTAAHMNAVLEVLDGVRRDYGIDTAVVYAHTAWQASIAHRARQQWGWKAVWPARVQNEGVPLLDRSEGSAVGTVEQPADALMRWGPAGPESPDGSPTWLQLWQPVDAALRTSFPRVSILVVTHNNLVFTRLCLESLLTNTRYPNYELVVVDNGSMDGTVPFLHDLARRYPHIQLILNTSNVGFARANNQGLTVASGEVLVLLNNDTILAPSWLTGLLRHLEDPSVGLVGPVTNRVSNEAQVETTYQTYGEFLSDAALRARTNAGVWFQPAMLVMFCVAMRRNVYQQIGPLDEQFELGMFEDDDYSMRVLQAGYALRCVEESFVHHCGQATIGALAETGEWGEIFHTNRRRFEKKWGVTWQTPQRHQNDAYQATVVRIAEMVHRVVPMDATVAVVTKGDESLLDLHGRRSWHLPRDAQGNYSGFYPAEGEDVVRALVAIIEDGATHLVIPHSARWWLDHYSALREYLETWGHVLADEPDTCVIFALLAPNAGVADGVKGLNHQSV